MTRCKSTISLPSTSKSQFPLQLSPNNIPHSLPHSPSKVPNGTIPEDHLRHHQINWDKHSTILFPALATTFNCIYWMFYLYLDKE